MDLPCKEKDNIKLEIICYQMKLPVPRMGYIFLSGWSKGSHRLPQTLQATVDDISYCLQSYCLTHHRLLLPKMEKRGWYSNESFNPTGYVLHWRSSSSDSFSCDP